jgi:hypothetical protein
LGLPAGVFQAIAEGIIASLQAEPRALVFTRLDQMFDAASRLHCRCAANGTSLIPPLPQLVFSLAGQGKIGELILNWFPHFFEAGQIVLIQLLTTPGWAPYQV